MARNLIVVRRVALRYVDSGATLSLKLHPTYMLSCTCTTVW